MRDGHEHVIHTDELVVGDLVLLSAGNRVPADIRLLHTTSLKLETSAITGAKQLSKLCNFVV